MLSLHSVRLAALWCAAAFCAAGWCAAADRPNILWLTCEDTGQELGCYGDKYAVTPNLDRLAGRGLRYLNAWSNAPVCAPARTTIISGVYPPSAGAEHMRSEVAMPALMHMYPELLRQCGYYCTNNSKTDYNLRAPDKLWDECSGKAHYKNRQPGQPFFAIFNTTVSHESQIRVRPHELKHDPAQASLPAYHPDTPEVRHDWAQYYDKVTEMDTIAGRHLKELEEAGLADDTIVFFYGDHGSGMPRSKRWPYNSGLEVAIIVSVPEKYRALAPKDYVVGGSTRRLVSFVDLAPTLLSLIGQKAPQWMQGQAFMGSFEAPARKYLYGFRGRMDERYDLVRSVRNERYVYVRNYLPHLVYGQYLAYMFQTPTTQVWKRMFDAGQLQPPKTYFWQPKPAEELYDLASDPDEVHNLVDAPAQRAVLDELREANRRHLLAIRDVGFLPEAEQHRRAGSGSLYELGHDAQKYPLEKILAMAELASSRAAGAEAQLRQGLADKDSGVRYWAATGLLIREAAAVRAAHAELRQALGDESPSVRIVAARALGLYGDAADLAAGLAVLKGLASPESNGVYVAMEALNAVDALGSKADSLKDDLRRLPTKDAQASNRTANYVPRLLQYILGEPVKDEAKKPGRKRGK